jgi:hypothetical protein
MLYFLAMIASPVAIWLCRRPVHAAANLALWVLAVPAFMASGLLAVLLVPVIDALFVVSDYQAERQVRDLATERTIVPSRQR